MICSGIRYAVHCTCIPCMHAWLAASWYIVRSSRAVMDPERVETTPSKRRKLSSTSPIDVATQIRRKATHIQQGQSPLSATARRLLLSKVRPAQGSRSPIQLLTHSDPTWTSQVERLCGIVSERYNRKRTSMSSSASAAYAHLRHARVGSEHLNSKYSNM